VREKHPPLSSPFFYPQLRERLRESTYGAQRVRERGREGWREEAREEGGKRESGRREGGTKRGQIERKRKSMGSCVIGGF